MGSRWYLLALTMASPLALLGCSGRHPHPRCGSRLRLHTLATQAECSTSAEACYENRDLEDHSRHGHSRRTIERGGGDVIVRRVNAEWRLGSATLVPTGYPS